jgi:antitoxin component of MazEF toxin-antitoxin module
MRAIQKLAQRGNSTAVTIPRHLLFHLGWDRGDTVVLELLEDNSIHIRLPRVSDFARPRAPRMGVDEPGVVKA